MNAAHRPAACFLLYHNRMVSPPPTRRNALLGSLLVLLVVWGGTLWLRSAGAPPAPDAAPLAAATPSVTEPAAAPVPVLVAELPPLLPHQRQLLPPRDVVTGPLDPQAVARAWVEEDRGQPMGLGARVNVPDELRHYEDDRRFLAVQMANAQEEHLELPHDDAELIEMLRTGQLVELPALTRDYVLYEVGQDAVDDPRAHYDVQNNRDVPLFASVTEYETERTRLEQAVAGVQTRDRGRAEGPLRLLRDYYDDPAQRERLLSEGLTVASLAADFGGTHYDLANPVERQRFKTRLLSCLRPTAREVLLGVAAEYHVRFQRLLPVTSLIRTQRYQRRLGRVNGNATRVEVPPHATGAAFDISYKFMAADEQQFLADRLSQLKRDGRVEVLRERRNHLHVFVFGEGQRPSESVIASLLDDVEAARGVRASEARPRGASKAKVSKGPRRPARAAVSKATPRKGRASRAKAPVRRARRSSRGR